MCKRFEEFIKLGYVLFYGPFASGKTNLALEAIKVLNKKALFINTEDAPVEERILEVNAQCDVVRVDDHVQLLWLILDESLLDYDVIVLDSINSLTRPLHPNIGIRVTAFLSWYLSKVSERGKNVIITAQVKEDGKIALGEWITPWVKGVARLEKLNGKRALSIEEPASLRGVLTFSIVREGVKWNC